MRLTALMTKQLDEQMSIDLAKLFPPEMLTDFLVQAEQPAWQWVLAKFNGRYIGAALFDLQGATLSALTVRDVTRRRGVGRLLVDYCRQQVGEQGSAAALRLCWPTLQADTQGFLSALRAKPDGADCWLL